MNRQFSVYMDAIRISASILVFLTHLTGFIGGWLWQLGGLGTEAVILFFVLSGFIISYITQNKETKAIDYVASRFARIYSVALPALILTIVLYYLGNYINPDAYQSVNERLINPVVTTIAALLFVNQSWWEVTVFSNLPYWSLGYEVLYYVFFGVMCFTAGIKKVVYLIIVTAIMGPSVLVYLPVWYLGVLCHKLTESTNVSILSAYMLYAISLILAVILCFSSVQGAINEVVHAYVGSDFVSLLNHNSDKFGSDYLLAIAMALNMFSFYFISAHVVIFNDASIRRIRYAASYTFSLYLYHMPILYFISAVAPFSDSPILNVIGSTFVTITLIMFLGHYTENKKTSYKNIFFAIMKRVSSTGQANRQT